MAMTLSELTKEVRDNVQRPAGGFSDARLTRRINWAQQEIARAHSFKEMLKVYTRATIENQKSYTYPCLTKEVFSFILQKDSSSRQLPLKKVFRQDKLYPYPEDLSTGVPSRWIDYGVNFELLPIPSGAYTLKIRVAVFPEDLTEDDDVSPLLEKDNLIIAFATKLCSYALREIEDAEYWANGECKRLLALAIETDKLDASWVPIARPFTLSQPSYRNPESPFA